MIMCGQLVIKINGKSCENARLKNETKQNKKNIHREREKYELLFREIATLWNSTWKKENLVLFNKINVLNVFERRNAKIATAKVTKNWKAKQKKWIFRTCMLRMYLLCNVNATLKKKLNKKKTTTKNRIFNFCFHFLNKYFPI